MRGERGGTSERPSGRGGGYGNDDAIVIGNLTMQLFVATVDATPNRATRSHAVVLPPCDRGSKSCGGIDDAFV